MFITEDHPQTKYKIGMMCKYCYWAVFIGQAFSTGLFLAISSGAENPGKKVTAFAVGATFGMAFNALEYLAMISFKANLPKVNLEGRDILDRVFILLPAAGILLAVLFVIGLDGYSTAQGIMAIDLPATLAWGVGLVQIPLFEAFMNGHHWLCYGNER